MQISSSAYMGVETLVRLAVQNADKPCTQGLAEWINRSVSYTESLMARLSNAGLVVSRHGPGGGYILARPAERITVAEVFQAFDDPSDFVSSFILLRRETILSCPLSLWLFMIAAGAIWAVDDHGLPGDARQDKCRGIKRRCRASR